MSPEMLRSKSESLWKMIKAAFPATSRRIGEDSYAFDITLGPFDLACYCVLDIEDMGYYMCCIFRPLIPPDRRASVSEFLHRVNFPLAVGCWAIDMDTGDVRWKAGFLFGDADISASLMFEQVRWSVFFVRKHVLGLVKLSIGRSLEEALRSIDEDPRTGIDLLAEWNAMQDCESDEDNAINSIH